MTNSLADLVEELLTAIHSRVYRNKSVTNPDTPYIVYTIRQSTDTVPSKDYLVAINVYGKNDGTESVRVIEDLADTIDVAFNDKIVDNTQLSVHFKEEMPRQFENDPSLSGVQLINLQYTGRTYRKE